MEEQLKTKGALLWQTNTPWSVEEIDVGEPHAHEVMIELAASGMCHSDEHLVTGASPTRFPTLGGHEGAGVVVAVGDGVTGVREGDHVVTAFVPACGKCPPCSEGRGNICDLGEFLLKGASISDGTWRVRARGENVTAMCQLGTFAPYATVHEASVVKIETDIPLEKAALVACGVPTGYGSAARIGDVRPGDNVVVMGVGGVGMNAVQGAAGSGARNVIAIDPVPAKREWAMTFGATHTFADASEAMTAVRDITWGRMAETTIICVGDVTGEHVTQGLALTGKGGRCVVTGMGDWRVNLDLGIGELTLLQKNLQGAIFGGANPRAEIPRLLSLYRDGRLNLDDLITRTYSLEDVNQGYQDMRDGKNIRGVITYSDADR